METKAAHTNRDDTQKKKVASLELHGLDGWPAGGLEGWHEEGARHNNPRPAGRIRPGSGTDVLLRFGHWDTWFVIAWWRAGLRSCPRASRYFGIG